MIVDYSHPVHGWFAQYCGTQAGYYPGLPRARRRTAEEAAHRDGAKQLGCLQYEPFGVPCGAPGLLGVSNSEADLNARRRRCYGPGTLP